MGCLYCGSPLPEYQGKGRPRKFCSKQCKDRYHVLLYQRKNKRTEHCKNCGRLLLWEAKDYCSEECRKRGERKPLSIEGINALRFAALKQAQHDNALARWAKKPEFYEIFPELTPEMMKGVRKK